MYNIDELNDRLLSELREIAEGLKLKNFKRASKQDLIYKILDEQAVNPDAVKPLKEESSKKEETAKKEETNKREKEEEKKQESVIKSEISDRNCLLRKKPRNCINLSF